MRRTQAQSWPVCSNDPGTMLEAKLMEISTFDTAGGETMKEKYGFPRHCAILSIAKLAAIWKGKRVIVFVACGVPIRVGSVKGDGNVGWSKAWNEVREEIYEHHDTGVALSFFKGNQITLAGLVNFYTVFGRFRNCTAQHPQLDTNPADGAICNHQR